MFIYNQKQFHIIIGKKLGKAYYIEVLDLRARSIECKDNIT